MERLKELRQNKMLMQKDMAQILGVDRTTYAKYESGKNQPSHEMLAKIADYFEVSIDYLLGRENSASSDDSIKVALFGGDSEVTDEMWNEVKNFTEYIKEKYKKK